MPPPPVSSSPRQRFNARIGALAVSLGLLNKETLQQAITLQERFVALALAEQPADLAGHWQQSPLYTRLRDQWETLAVESGVTSETQQQARQQVQQATDGLPAAHAPAMGALLIALQAIPPGTLHALLVAQTAERTLRCIEQFPEDEVPEVHPALETIKHLPLWERTNTAGDPERLTGIQQVLYSARLLDAAVRSHPSLADTKAISGAKAALIVLVTAAFEEAGCMLSELTRPTKAIVDGIHQQWTLERPVSPALVHAALQALHAAMDATDTSLGQRYADELVARRQPSSDAEE